VGPGFGFLWLQLQRHGGLTEVCIAVVSQLVVHWPKCLSFGLIRIQSRHTEVLVDPGLAGVER